MKKLLLLFCLAAVLPACKFFKKKNSANGEQVVARVGDEYLYMADLSAMLKGANGDSSKIISGYADAWVRKKLLLKKAEENVSSDELGIDRKVADYRESLMLYEYEKELINQKLDKAVNAQEVSDYYEKNKTNFALETDVYQVQYIRLKPDAEDLNKMRPLILSTATDDSKLKIEGYCKAISRDYSLAENSWYGLASLLKLLPLTEEVINALPLEKFKEFKSDKEVLFVKLVAVKHKGDAAPLDFIKDQIRELLINKKKVILIQRIYDKIYEDGKKSGAFEILVK